MDNWTKIPDDKTIEQTVASLKENGIEAFIVENREEAKKKTLELVPLGAEVFTMTSVTLDEAGISKEINESGKYDSVRNKLYAGDLQGREKQKMGAAPEWALGSVHALTQDGHVLIASNTGSQLAAEVYGADHVIWVVGAQKIVKDTDAGMKRIREHVLPLESVRANEAYKITTGSFVSKLLIINREINPDRIKAVIVKESLGF